MAFAKSPKKKARSQKNSIIWRRREADWSNRFTLLGVRQEEDPEEQRASGRVQVMPTASLSPEEATFDEISRCLRIRPIGDFSYLPNSDALRWRFSGICLPSASEETSRLLDLRLISKGGDKVIATLDSGASPGSDMCRIPRTKSARGRL